MSVKDMIKKSVLESDNFVQSVSWDTMSGIIINMLLAVLLGVCIYLVYKNFYNGVIYSRSYALTLVGMTCLTCMVTLAISTNIVISLGMVGALSIVRYRTAIKEPLDLLYMFWAITSGITLGASMYILVLVGFVVMTVFIAVCFSKKSRTQTYILMVQYVGAETGDEILRELNKTRYQVKSKIFRNELTEMTIQVECRDTQMVIAEKIQQNPNVKNTSFVQFNGEYHG